MGTYIILLTFMILGFIGAGGFIKDIDKISNKNNSKKDKQEQEKINELEEEVRIQREELQQLREKLAREKANNKKKKSVAKKKRDKQNINKYSTILFSSYPILFSLPFFEQIKELTYLEYSSVYQAIYYTFFEEFLKGYFSN